MAILSFLFRIRIAVLAPLVLASAAIFYLTLRGQDVPVDGLFLACGSFLIGTTIAFIHLRHAGLAIIMTLSPLPGMVAAGPFAIQHGLTISGLLVVYGFAYAAAACLCGDTMRSFLDDTSRISALRTALAPIVLALLAAVTLIIGWLFRDAGALACAAASELCAASASVLVFVPFAASVIPCGETFIVRANRARERRERALRPATLVIEPRWGLSLTGIALVFATLGWFGAQSLVEKSVLLAQPALWGASALLLFLVALALGRDWREATAITLALCTLSLLTLWLLGKANGHFTSTSFMEMAVIIAAALLLMLMQLRRNKRYRQGGDEAAIARLRAIEDTVVAQFFGSLGASAAIAPWILLHGSIATLAVLFLFAGTMTLLAAPAIATATDAIMRRRRSLDELYGRG